MRRKYQGHDEWLCGVGDFAHQGEEVAFCVVEVVHPQLVRGHASDQMRFIFKFHAR